MEYKLEERSEGWSWLLMQINIKACSKLILLSLVGVTRHADSIQNDYAVSLEYIKDELNDESDFLDADKHFFFLHVGTIFWWVLPGLPKVPIQVCNIFAISQERSSKNLNFLVCA